MIVISRRTSGCASPRGRKPPPFDPEAAPRLDLTAWPAERLAKANRNYAMEYIRTTLPRMAELFGPADAAALGNLAGKLIGMQHYAETATLLGIAEPGPAGFARWLCAMGEAQGDRCEPRTDGSAVLVQQTGWRLMHGLSGLSPAVFDAWCGLYHGALAVHDRFSVLEVLQRPDYGDGCILWRIRRKG